MTPLEATAQTEPCGCLLDCIISHTTNFWTVAHGCTSISWTATKWQFWTIFTRFCYGDYLASIEDTFWQLLLMLELKDELRTTYVEECESICTNTGT